MTEFKAFIQRGNVVDMAIGVIMGGAFGKIVNSLVADVLTPPLGFVTGGVDFKQLSAKLTPPAIGDAIPTAVEIKYGLFLQATFDFLIIAFCVFMIVKLMNKMKQKDEAKAAVPAAPPNRRLKKNCSQKFAISSKPARESLKRRATLGYFGCVAC